MILAGDIGGTKTHLALYTFHEGTLKMVAQQRFASRDFSSLEGVIAAFDACHGVPLHAACFGIAGPVVDGVCRTTNLAWEITTPALQKYLNTLHVKLLNDLEATAYGMLYLDEDQFVSLNPQGRERLGNRAVIAAGTGLGEAMLFYDGAAYHPIGSEGGHGDFAPVTPQQDALLAWLRERFSGHVSYERVLSGPAIVTLYEFVLHHGSFEEPHAIQNRTSTDDASALISRLALDEHDALCMETMRLFVQIYGAEAGNLALKSLAIGGIYIGGGIAPKILPLLQEGHFLDAFASKGRFEGLLRAMQIKVSLEAETALLGAAHYAADKLLTNMIK